MDEGGRNAEFQPFDIRYPSILPRHHYNTRHQDYNHYGKINHT